MSLPSEGIDAAIEMAAEEALGTLRQMLARPERLAPFAIVIGYGGIITMPILDLSVRFEALRFAVGKVEGDAFVLFYDGVVPPTAGRPPQDALFRLQMTRAGSGLAVAYPYERLASGITFGTAVVHPETDWIHAAVFGVPVK